MGLFLVFATLSNHAAGLIALLAVQRLMRVNVAATEFRGMYHFPKPWANYDGLEGCSALGGHSTTRFLWVIANEFITYKERRP